MHSGRASTEGLASSCLASDRRALPRCQRLSQLDATLPLPQVITVPEALHTIYDMRDFLRRRAIVAVADDVAYPRELYRRARDMFMRLINGPERRRRGEFRLCHPTLLLRLPALHFGSPMYHAPSVEQRLPPMFGPSAECEWNRYALLRITAEGVNP